MSTQSQVLADQYRRLSHRDHILELPDTYIGSIETHEEYRWVYDPEAKKMAHRKVNFNPGFYKLFDEIVVNARDALIRSQTEKEKQPVKHIDVVAKADEKGVFTISVENDGDGIPVVEHTEYKVWVPELIFGHLLTSGNYNKEEEKIVGGKNGYGAKLANIFSKQFTVETRDPKVGLKYTQTWSNHMSSCSKPSVKADKAKGFVKISFQPDLTRFTNLDMNNMNDVLRTRAIELSALAGKDVKITWNGEAIPTNTFEKFTNLFVRDEASIAYEKCSERWEVAAVLTRSLFEDEDSHDERHVSFANGVNTKKGGKHVETVSKHILGDFCELAAKKKKLDIKPSQLKDSVLFFVNATIVNPSFDSQTKEYLTTPANKFGSQFKCSPKFTETLVKMGLLEEAQSILDAKAAKDAKKTDGAKKKTIRGIPKLEDALWAGTAQSSQCTLILTEGDSAATSAISGLKIVGRETWGVFPLKGKMLNVKDISLIKFNQNEELTAIKKILGLEQGKKYQSVKDLRYGRVMVMADQDLDGAHIKGLLMNLFHTEWPTLMKIGFICSLMTPLLKATKRNDTLSFYSQPEFEAWKDAQGEEGMKGWKLKYYKGLGTSTPAEAREWFQQLHEIKYKWDDATDESVSLAFSKKRADDRKMWLSTYDAKRMVKLEKDGSVGFSRFIHDELIHFSNADNLRSLPHLMDGLKPSQRKILFGCLKRGLKSEIRVAQLAGYVSEHAAYHHGEASLNSTIVGMAQTFMGSNNINLLVPIGQFGSRLLGGKDSASPRYIHTHLEHIVESLFRKEDSAILDYQEDDGLTVEPETYLPVVPLLAINGCVGIGTGFSTDIPPHHPMTVVTMLRDRLTGKQSTLDGLTVQPWWFGFKGPIIPSGDAWITKGLYTMDDVKKTVTITELPVGTWTKDYKVFLDELASGEKAGLNDAGKLILKSFDDLYDDDTVRFILYIDSDYYEDIKADINEFEKRFRLTTTWRLSNMTCFNNEMQIVKYSCIGDMIEAFFGPRLEAYETRRLNEMGRLEREALEADAKARFLRAVLEGDIDLRKASDEEIVSMMIIHELPPLSDPAAAESVDGYEYLLRLRMDRVKASAIEDAEKAVMAARMAYESLRDTTASALWLSDLDDFETAWAMMQGHRENAASGTGSSVQKKRRVKKA